MAPNGLYDLVDFFDSFFDDFTPSVGRRIAQPPKMLVDEMAFPTNIFVDNETKNLIYEIAAAGISREDINISTESQGLSIEFNTHKKDKEERNADEKFKCIKKGIASSYKKQFLYIPSDKYQLDAVKASMKNGILRLEVPAQEKERPKRIPIEITSEEEREAIGAS